MVPRTTQVWHIVMQYKEEPTTQCLFNIDNIYWMRPARHTHSMKTKHQKKEKRKTNKKNKIKNTPKIKKKERMTPIVQ